MVRTARLLLDEGMEFPFETSRDPFDDDFPDLPRSRRRGDRAAHRRKNSPDPKPSSPVTRRPAPPQPPEGHWPLSNPETNPAPAPAPPNSTPETTTQPPTERGGG